MHQADVVSRYCKQSEENDPGEEFEEYLACLVCGDNGKCAPHCPQRQQLQLSKSINGRIAAQQ